MSEYKQDDAWFVDLISAAEERAAMYDGDERDCIKTDVINAFFAGADWQCRRVIVRAADKLDSSINSQFNACQYRDECRCTRETADKLAEALRAVLPMAAALAVLKGPHDYLSAPIDKARAALAEWEQKGGV